MDPLPNRRRRFRPAVIPTLAMVALVAATLSLGNWQARRAEYKRGLAAQHDAALRAGPIELGPESGIDSSLRYRAVRVRGEFIASAQMLLDNRIHRGRVGYEVLAPLRIRGSDVAVLVDRGWVAMGADRSSLPSPAVPSGPQSIEGRLDFPPASGEGRGAPSGTLWQHVDLPAMSVSVGRPLLPALVQQTSPDASAPEIARDWPAPDFGIERHEGYMLQWYSLAALAVVLWLALNWRRQA
jgi:surfeit locus 1 family protein